MSIKYKSRVGRVQPRRPPIECQYPKCKKRATHSLGMADPDAEKNYYCKEHCDVVKMNTIMNLFGKESSSELEGKK